MAHRRQQAVWKSGPVAGSAVRAVLFFTPDRTGRGTTRGSSESRSPMTAPSRPTTIKVAMFMTCGRIALPAGQNNPSKERYGTQRTGGAFASSMPTSLLVLNTTVAELTARIGEAHRRPAAGVAAQPSRCSRCRVRREGRGDLASTRAGRSSSASGLRVLSELRSSGVGVAPKSIAASSRSRSSGATPRRRRASADVGVTLIQTIDQFDAALAVIAPHVRDNMSGDIFAARALAAAARQVEENNLRGTVSAHPIPPISRPPAMSQHS